MFFIYKIVNPAGSIYIGQTSDIADRKKRYKHKRCKGQVKLYHSILKYGWPAHSFEIIEECTNSNYGAREIYWIDFYKSNYAKHKAMKGLNLCDGGEGNKGCKHREETRKANSDRAKTRGTQFMNTKEAREKARNSLLIVMKGKFKGKDNPNYGNRWTDEMKKKASEKRLGKPGFANKEKLSEAGKKRWQDPEYRKKMAKICNNNLKNYWAKHPEKLKASFKNIDREYNRQRIIECRGRKVIDLETGKVFPAIAVAARHLGVRESTLRQKLNGRRTNNTTFRFYELAS